MVANITPLPPAPVRGSTEATFSAAANTFVAALPTLVTEINAAGDDIEQAVIDAEAAKTAAELAETNAEAAEDGAVAAANYKGEWSSLVGPLAIPATVSHNGVVWLLKANLADVTASEPTLVNSDWIALTQPISTGISALISEFELEMDSASVGDLVALYSNGKVRVVKEHPGETTVSSATSTFVSAIALSTTKGIQIYRDESDGNKVKAQLYSIAGRKITLVGTPVTIANTSATYVHADKIDASNVIAVYQDTSDSSQGKAIVINISGNTITTGSAAIFNAAVTTYCKVAMLSATKGVVAYRDEGNSNYGVACTLTVSGTAITPGTEVNFKTAATLYIDICRLTDIKCVVSYLGTSSYPEAVILDVNPGIVVGTNFTLKSAATTATTISRLTDTTCVAAYESGSLLYARHLTASSGTLSAGTEISISANPSFLESCQLTSTRVLVTARNATVSNQGWYWVIDNTSGSTLSNSSSAAFNAGATSHTFPSEIQDNRVLIGYQDNALSNYGVAYVLDLSTETLKSIAGIVKEAGVEGNTIDVVTQGEVDFLSGLTPGSYYYSSATGALSATIGDYEVGVAKSATNLKLNAVIPKVDAEKIKFIERLIANNMTPSIEQALLYDFWKTREVKTTTGTFTVPSNVYAIGIFCLGAGADATSGGGGRGGAGGGLAMKIKRVVPGQAIPYTISSGIAICDGMTANPGVTITGGAASGGMFNFSGGSIYNSTSMRGGAGCGGTITLGTASRSYSAGGSMAHWGQTSFASPTDDANLEGGMGMWYTEEVRKSHRSSRNDTFYGGGGFGCRAFGTESTNSFISGGVGRPPQQLGIFVTTDITGSNGLPYSSSDISNRPKAGDWNGGASAFSNSGLGGDGGLGGGGGYAAESSRSGGSGGLGGGGGTSEQGNGGNGGLGGGGGANRGASAGYSGGAGGYGGGGANGGTAGSGGSSVVIFVY